MKNYKLIPLLLLTLIGSSIALAGGSSVGITETNVGNKLLTAGINDQRLMNFTVEPWKSIPGDLKFTTIDFHCTPGEGFSQLKLKAGEELTTTEFTLGEKGQMVAHFDEVDFTIPNGVATEFELLVNVEENTGDFITACALDNLEFLNLESEIQYEAGRYILDFNMDTLIYVDDLEIENKQEEVALNYNMYDTPLKLDSKNNKLLKFKFNSTEDLSIEDLFISCPNSSELKSLTLAVGGMTVDATDIHVNWLTASRPEHSWDKRVIFTDLGIDIGPGNETKTFELYGDTHDYFSNMTGPNCSVLAAMTTNSEGENVELNLIQEPIGYSDVSPTNNYFPAISYLTQKGVFEGYDDGTFKTLNLLNRAELLKTLVIATGANPTLEEGYEFCFPDVAQEWFAPFVCYAKEKNWVAGYPDGNFYPAREVIKVEAIKMLVNSQGYPVTPVFGGDSLFSDVDESQWYASFIKAAKYRGLLEENDIYGVSEKMKRGQISENLYRAMLIAEEGLSYYSNPKKGALNYNNAELGIAFDYPSDWEVQESNEDIRLAAPKRYDMNYRISAAILPAESFEEYEINHQEEIEEGRISIKEMEMTFGSQDYSTKEYSQHGGITYLVKVGEGYVSITTEGYFDEQQKEEIGVILNSLSFYDKTEIQTTPEPETKPVDTSMCGSDAYNCSDFSAQSEAQSIFDQCWVQVGKDIHNLDGDGNGIACESSW